VTAFGVRGDVVWFVRPGESGLPGVLALGCGFCPVHVADRAAGAVLRWPPVGQGGNCILGGALGCDSCAGGLVH